MITAGLAYGLLLFTINFLVLANLIFSAFAGFNQRSLTRSTEQWLASGSCCNADNRRHRPVTGSAIALESGASRAQRVPSRAVFAADTGELHALDATGIPDSRRRRGTVSATVFSVRHAGRLAWRDW